MLGASRLPAGRGGRRHLWRAAGGARIVGDVQPEAWQERRAAEAAPPREQLLGRILCGGRTITRSCATLTTQASCTSAWCWIASEETDAWLRPPIVARQSWSFVPVVGFERCGGGLARASGSDAGPLNQEELDSLTDKAIRKHRREEAAGRAAPESLEDDAEPLRPDTNEVEDEALIWLLVVPGYLGRLGDEVGPPRDAQRVEVAEKPYRCWGDADGGVFALGSPWRRRRRSPLAEEACAGGARVRASGRCGPRGRRASPRR